MSEESRTFRKSIVILSRVKQNVGKPTLIHSFILNMFSYGNNRMFKLKKKNLISLSK